MAVVNFETSDVPHITFDECAGELIIIGSDVKQVTIEVEGEEDNLLARREGEAFTLTTRSDCYVTCPAETSLTLHHASGEVCVRCVGGPLAIEATQDDVSLRDVGPASIRLAKGGFDARHVRGELGLGQVNGDVRLRHVEGKLKLERCSGDLNARDLEGGAEVQDVGGDILLNSELTPGQAYHLHARGDIKARIPSGSSARCVFEAGGEVHCDLELPEGEKAAQRVVGQLGAGEALIELRAEGDVSVRGDGREESADVEVRIETVIEAEIAEMERRLREELSVLEDIGEGIGEEMRREAVEVAERARLRTEREIERARRKAERMGEKVRRQAEKAAERVRRRTEKETERARRKAEKVAGRVHRRAKASDRRRATSFQFTWDRASAGEARHVPEDEPVNYEERLAVLRMVEQKKISVDEAALLLEALEG